MRCTYCRTKTKISSHRPRFFIRVNVAHRQSQRYSRKNARNINNQVKLGWLIDRKTCRVEIYRQGQEQEVVESPAELSGEDILPGFVLNLQALWA
ncbi:MAG: Uma2 family endonuclease [Microcoleus sp.]|uniref:Uma2 family endonuclease n=1 Tax=Microcoleus sp. TaxID=44472 RepID=UPI003C724DE6